MTTPTRAPAITIWGTLNDMTQLDCVFDALSPDDLVYPDYMTLLTMGRMPTPPAPVIGPRRLTEDDGYRLLE